MDQRGHVMARIPFYLVTGFLGSGKTTLVKQVLERNSEYQKIAVVQNEFSPGMADGSTLKRTGKEFVLLEVNNGSVFCVCLLGSFVRSLQQFLDEHQPDLVLMEASGLSDPVSIGEMLNGAGLGERLYLAYIWCIADAVNFRKLALIQTQVRHQVAVADMVVVNKCDLVPAGDVMEICQQIKQINPFANIVNTSWCDIPLHTDPVPFGMAPVAVRQQEVLAGLKPSGRPDIGSEVIRETRPIPRDKLDVFLGKVVPGAWRIKGTVRLEGGGSLAVQACFGDLRTEFLPGREENTELIGLGPELTAAGFGDRFRDYLEV